MVTSWPRPGPRLFFNREIGPHRRVEHLAVPFDDVELVENALGGRAATYRRRSWRAGSAATRRAGASASPKIKVFCPVSVRDETGRYKLGNGGPAA